jgi:indole-3-glycerol phosphate synthase
MSYNLLSPQEIYKIFSFDLRSLLLKEFILTSSKIKRVRHIESLAILLIRYTFNIMTSLE